MPSSPKEEKLAAAINVEVALRNEKIHTGLRLQLLKGEKDGP